MGPEDDPEAFLAAFEWVALAAARAPEQWDMLLAMYFMGASQAAYWSLPNKEARDNRAVKAAILDILDVIPKTFQHRFRGKIYPLGARLCIVTQELKDARWSWLQPERNTAIKLAEQVIVEQCSHILPP